MHHPLSQETLKEATTIMIIMLPLQPSQNLSGIRKEVNTREKLPQQIKISSNTDVINLKLPVHDYKIYTKKKKNQNLKKYLMEQKT